MTGKPDRFAAAAGALAIAISLVPLCLAGTPAAALKLGFSISLGERHASLAGRVAKEVGAVRGRFVDGRRALTAVAGPGGRPAYRGRDVAALVDATQGDLDRALASVGEPALAPLRGWAADELLRVRGALAPAGVQAAALAAPRPVAVVAGLWPLASSQIPAPTAAQAPPPSAAEAERSGQALDRVERLLGRLFTLASNDDLEVELWVGSTPAERATFRFWPQGYVGGAPPPPAIVKTDGKRKKVVRGLYAYSAALDGAPPIEYPAAGAGAGVGSASAARPVRLDAAANPAAATERLDLVNGSPFFCCEFAERYCHHVDAASDCQAGRR